MLGIVVSLLFLLSIAARELILRLTVYGKEIRVKKFTLYAFGGVYQEQRSKLAAEQRPLLYLAKYLSNLVIAAIFYGLYATFINTGYLMLAGVTQWLTYIYFIVFLLHFFPAYPLDGGEILRNLLWKSKGDYFEATRIAGWIGWAAGFFLMFCGVLVFIVTQQWIMSLVMLVFGWIIEIAAGNIRREIKTQMALQNIKAEEIMSREYPVMPREVNIDQVIREQILRKGWHYVIVAEDSELKGILTMDQIKAVPGKNWNKTTIGDIMTPLDKIGTAHLQQSADMLLAEMHQKRLDYMPILDGDKIVGVVNRKELVNLARIRTGFGA